MEEIEDPWCTPSNPRKVPFQEVTQAAFKIKDGLQVTPCIKSHMCQATGMQLYLKKEFLHYTGSFKERGALYSLLNLNDEERRKGVVAASAGNHAQALSYHGMRLSVPVTVVMPNIAPILKIQRCKHYKANVIVAGKDMAEAKSIALKKAQDERSVYINGYDHPWILAGQGTCALEILDQVPDVDAIICGIGGGGLIAGVAVAIKNVKPHVKVIGVESDRCSSFANSMKAGKPVYTKVDRTLADGLAVPVVGYNAFATAAPLIDGVVVVKDEWIPLAILRLVEMEKAVVEGAGAVSIAAILAGQMDDLKGKKVVVILSGGNIDTTIFGKCLERGLVMDGRLQRFSVAIGDRPGGIAELTELLGSMNAQIKDIVRDMVPTDVFHMELKVLIETVNKTHAERVKRGVLSKYPNARFYEFPLPATLEKY